MTVFEARKWVIVASLAMAGAAFCFFIVAPAAGYPLRFSQAITLLQIVFPVFLGYLGAATQFVFQKAPPPDDAVPARPLMGLLIHGPIGLFVLVMVVVVATFGYSNRAAAGPGDGMSVELLGTTVTAAMGLLAVTTNVAVAYLFATEKRAAPKPPPKKKV